LAEKRPSIDPQEHSMKLARHFLVITLFCFSTMYVAASDAPASGLVQLAKVKASNGTTEDRFGSDIAASGNTVVIGQWNRNTQIGSVYVFVKSKRGWSDMTETAQIVPPEGTAFYGNVAIDGDTLIAGATVNGVESVCVFVKPTTGWADATVNAVLTPSDSAGNGFGNSLAISGDTVVVGAVAFDSVGAAYVFVKPAGGWASETQTAKLTDGVVGSGFGNAVAIDADTIVLGVPYKEIGFNFDGGALDVFVKPASGWTDNMTPTAQLTAPVSLLLGDGPNAISGDTIIAGDIGRVLIFVAPATGWRDTRKATASLTDGVLRDKDNFGATATINGNTIVVGAFEATVGSHQQQGAAYIFQKPATGWKSTSSFSQMLTASDGHIDDWFGTAVAIAGSAIVVGADDATIDGNFDQGAAYIFGH
jgi:hypothetical protein